jgi:UDP-glucose 4-epimerase
VQAARRVSGSDFRVEVGARRPGDPAQLFASPDKIFADLGWQAKQSDLLEIVESAWRWFRDHPDGYKSV